MTNLNDWQAKWKNCKSAQDVFKVTGRHLWEIDELKEVMGSSLLKRVPDDKVKKEIKRYLYKFKIGETRPIQPTLKETVMTNEVTRKKNKNPTLTKQLKKQVIALHKSGKSYTDIASELKIGYWQAAHAVKRGIPKRSYKKRAPIGYGPVEKTTKETSFDNAATWKAKYLKAVALLVEHDIIEVNL